MLNLKKGGVSEEVLGRGFVVSDFLFLSREKTNFILNCYKSKRLVFILRTLEKESEGRRGGQVPLSGVRL